MANCSICGTLDVRRRVDHDLLCRGESKQKPTQDKEHHKGGQSSPGLVAVGYGKAEKVVLSS
jgi:hypothetical protein